MYTTFDNIITGDRFVFESRLYMKTGGGDAICIAGGENGETSKFPSSLLIYVLEEDKPRLKVFSNLHVGDFFYRTDLELYIKTYPQNSVINCISLSGEYKDDYMIGDALELVVLLPINFSPLSKEDIVKFFDGENN